MLAAVLKGHVAQLTLPLTRVPLLQVPLLMAEQGTHTTVCTALGLAGAPGLDLREWKTQIADRWDAICADPVRRFARFRVMVRT